MAVGLFSLWRNQGCRRQPWPAPHYTPPDIGKGITGFLPGPGGPHDAPGHLVAFLVNRRPVHGEALEGKGHGLGSAATYREAQLAIS